MKTIISITTLLINVAYAAPTISNLGNPNNPYIKIIFNRMFKTFENIDMYIGGFVN